jgi:hypothetical protein
LFPTSANLGGHAMSLQVKVAAYPSISKTVAFNINVTCTTTSILI